MRTCGDCIVCCTYLKISSIGKKGLCHCPHASLAEPEKEGTLFYTGASTEGNCKIYEDQPAACSGYTCMWLRGYGEEEDRPDRCGMLIDTVKPIKNCIQAKPLWEGAQDSPEGIAAVERIAKQTNVPALVAGFPETHMIRVVGQGPND